MEAFLRNSEGPEFSDGFWLDLDRFNRIIDTPLGKTSDEDKAWVRRQLASSAVPSRETSKTNTEKSRAISTASPDNSKHSLVLTPPPSSTKRLTDIHSRMVQDTTTSPGMPTTPTPKRRPSSQSSVKLPRGYDDKNSIKHGPANLHRALTQFLNPEIMSGRNLLSVDYQLAQFLIELVNDNDWLKSWSVRLSKTSKLDATVREHWCIFARRFDDNDVDKILYLNRFAKVVESHTVDPVSRIVQSDQTGLRLKENLAFLVEYGTRDEKPTWMPYNDPVEPRHSRKRANCSSSAESEDDVLEPKSLTTKRPKHVRT